MPSCNKVVKDTVTGLFLKTYATQIENCEFAGISLALCFDNQEQADATAADLNTQSSQGRFIGTNPPPR